MFTKILIANRGEIACRVIRTARRLGIETVAVYSEADAGSRHVRLADAAVLIGPAPAPESYLNIERIVAAARKTGAQAIHPGYGFLSESGDFADACAKANVVFIGPPPEAIRAMGSKSAAKTRMAKAGVPLVPGYHGEDQDPEVLKAEAGKIGYPVLIKSSAGGGGKGLRIVEKEAEFLNSLASCRREAISSFGDGRALIEKYLEKPRHLEIQVFADRHGNCVHLFDRDCSVQRRHQKLLEEAPAPGLTEKRRREMGEAALQVARAINYVGAGTVEFIAGQDGRFYFMEMNTRLQVEHPVTELITGLDLVEWQLRIAAGETLPLAQGQLSIRGCAIEARVYAEDADNGFLPSTGKIVHLGLPEESPNVRVDAGVEQGDEITPHYEPLVAKLIVWDADRDRAIARMRQALAQCRVSGVATNVEFLARLAACPAFVQGELDTGFIERERSHLFPERSNPPREAFLAAALATLLREAETGRPPGSADGDPSSPWKLRDGWRLNSTGERVLIFRFGKTEHRILIGYHPGCYQLTLDGTTTTGRGKSGGNSVFQVELDGLPIGATVVAANEKRHVFLLGRSFQLAEIDPLSYASEGCGPDGGLLAPIPGRIAALLVKSGDKVAKGAPLLILEAMKMELTILAPAAGSVSAFRFAVGASVTEGAQLLDFEAGE